MMIDTNRKANYFPHTYHIRSCLTVNGVRQWFSPPIEAYLNNLTTEEAAVLAVLRTDTALSRNEIIIACRDYLLEQADPDFLDDYPTLPTDDDIAIAIVYLVDSGVAELVVIKEASVSAPITPLEREASASLPANPLEQDSQGNPTITHNTANVPVSLASAADAVMDSPLNWLQQLCFPWENQDGGNPSTFMGSPSGEESPA